MTETTLEDRRGRLFGRDADLRALRARATERGLTAIVAQPQMGKSWLMMELARGLDETPGWLVGLAESHGETPDLLLRAIVDLYQRWLGDLNRRQKALIVWEQQKTNLLPAFATVFGKIAGELPHVGKLAGGVVKAALDGLVSANQTLATGGITLPTLHYAQARDLVSSVAAISECRIAIFLDQWEKTPSPDLEAKTLDSFLRHCADWPACHIFIALRPDDGARKILDTLASDHARATIYKLLPMNLEEKDERSRLTLFLRNEVPAAKHTSDDRLLELLQGYPRVIDRWVADRDDMQGEEDLCARAKDANAYRYRDLEDRLRGLADDARSLAARLALVPMTAEQAAWGTLREPVLGTTSVRLLDLLMSNTNILETSNPPSFGHATRWEASRDYLFKFYPNLVEEEAGALIERLGATVTGLDERHAAAVFALVELSRVARDKRLGAIAVALCEAATSLLGVAVDPSGLLAGSQAVRNGNRADLAGLLARGLFNALTHAVHQRSPNDADSVANELRALATNFPSDGVVHRMLAAALQNRQILALDQKEFDRADALLQHLFELAKGWSENEDIQESFARALCTTQLAAIKRGDLTCSQERLEQLRHHVKRWNNYREIRVWLAEALLNTLNDAIRRDEADDSNALLAELRGLVGEWPRDDDIYRKLAKGLFVKLSDAIESEQPHRAGPLLEELQKIAAFWPKDGEIRELLVVSLRKSQAQAIQQKNPDLRDELLGEIRDLTMRWPHDGRVLGSFASALCGTQLDAIVRADTDRRDVLLEELRALAKRWPEHREIRIDFARALYNTRSDAGKRRDLARQDMLLGELRQLAMSWNTEKEIINLFSAALVNAHIDAIIKVDRIHRDALLEELRNLAKARPEDLEIRCDFAKSLYHALYDAKERADPDCHDMLLGELRDIANRWPDDGAVHEILVRAESLG